MRTLTRGIQRYYLETSAYKKKKVPCVFLDLASGSESSRVRIKLYDHINPEASENFKQICQGYKLPNGQNLTFTGRKFINSLRNYFVETERMDETIHGGPIHNETYNVSFDRPGLVGLSQHQTPGDEVSGSGFFITLHKMPNLQKYVAVGEVIEGLDFVRKCNLADQPLEIKGCGVEGEVSI